MKPKDETTVNISREASLEMALAYFQQSLGYKRQALKLDLTQVKSLLETGNSATDADAALSLQIDVMAEFIEDGIVEILEDRSLKVNLQCPPILEAAQEPLFKDVTLSARITTRCMLDALGTLKKDPSLVDTNFAKVTAAANRDSVQLGLLDLTDYSTLVLCLGFLGV